MIPDNSAWLSVILDTIDEGIHAVDTHGVTTVYNQAASKMDGLSQGDVLGKHVLEAFPSLTEDTSTLLRVLRSGRGLHNRPQTYTNFLGVKVHTVNTSLPIYSSGHMIGAVEIAKDLTQVKHLSEQVIELQAQVLESRGKRSQSKMQLDAKYEFADILTNDPRLIRLKDRALRSAQTPSPILVFGETGTGKELLVQSLHNESPRRKKPFLALNCAALPATLLEGILFGTVKGSFTGAEDRPGMFELADDGTLFLDEIQSMPLELQAKLLRVLQEDEVMRVGDTKVRRLNVRVIAAMNQSPEDAVNAGLLRHDLYYRINVVRFDLPPLRERVCDIELLAGHFIEKFNRSFKTLVTGLDDEVLKVLMTYPWPGNVRELENCIEAALNLVSTGTIGLDALPQSVASWVARNAGSAENSARAENPVEPVESSYGDWTDRLAEAGMNQVWEALSEPNCEPIAWKQLEVAFERIILEKALHAAHHNVKQTAARLGVPRQTLQYRIRQLGL